MALTEIVDGLVREEFQNLYYRQYHLTTKDVSESKISKIQNLEGVVPGFLSSKSIFDAEQYYISISIGKAFKWSDIEPRILTILQGQD